MTKNNMGRPKIKNRKCSICEVKQSKIKEIEHWYKLDGKYLCRNCWQRLNTKYKKSHSKAVKNYRLNNKEKAIAHNRTNYLKLRKDFCENCGNKETRLEAHHFDYSKPKQVITLCVNCHKNVHRGINYDN